MSNTVAAHFEDRSPSVRQTYDAIVAAAKRFGRVTEDPKKTSIHLNHRTAFAGVATRKDALILTIKSPSDIKSPRIHKHEQASANRWHLEVRLKDPTDVDRELVQWLENAFAISG